MNSLITEYLNGVVSIADEYNKFEPFIDLEGFLKIKFDEYHIRCNIYWEYIMNLIKILGEVPKLPIVEHCYICYEKSENYLGCEHHPDEGICGNCVLKMMRKHRSDEVPCPLCKKPFLLSGINLAPHLQQKFLEKMPPKSEFSHFSDPIFDKLKYSIGMVIGNNQTPELPNRFDWWYDMFTHGVSTEGEYEYKHTGESDSEEFSDDDIEEDFSD